MITKMALGVALGITTRAALEFYTRLKELDDFGRMPIAEAVEMISEQKGTVAQHERLVALGIAQLHAANDAAKLKADKMDKFAALLNSKNEKDDGPGQFL